MKRKSFKYPSAVKGPRSSWPKTSAVEMSSFDSTEFNPGQGVKEIIALIVFKFRKIGVNSHCALNMLRCSKVQQQSPQSFKHHFS